MKTLAILAVITPTTMQYQEVTYKPHKPRSQELRSQNVLDKTIFAKMKNPRYTKK